MATPDRYKSQPSDLIRAQQQGQPEAIMTWVRLPDGRIRLYASRRLADLAWGQREQQYGPVLWHLDGNMDQVLIVDRQTAAEALAWVLDRWAREDAESERDKALTSRKAIDQPPAEMKQLNAGI